jgi:hypothetical protein
MQSPPYMVLLLQGGLGNQLFQYAGALALKRAIPGVKLWLTPVSENKHSGRDYRSIFYTEGIALEGKEGEPRQEDPYFVWWPSDPFFTWSPDDLARTAEAVAKIEGGPGPLPLFLRAYFQHLPPIRESVAPFVRHVVLKKLGEQRIYLCKKYGIEDPRGVAFVHVRRGDFLTLPADEFWVQEDDYYRKGLQTLKSKAITPLKKIFLLSDDPEWCAAQNWVEEEDILEVVDEPDEIGALSLMSLCHGGAVIANSTFSWWGAWIGPEAAGATVVYPSRWYKDAEPDLFPAGWIRV